MHSQKSSYFHNSNGASVTYLVTKNRTLVFFFFFWCFTDMHGACRQGYIFCSNSEKIRNTCLLISVNVKFPDFISIFMRNVFVLFSICRPIQCRYKRSNFEKSMFYFCTIHSNSSTYIFQFSKAHVNRKRRKMSNKIWLVHTCNLHTTTRFDTIPIWYNNKIWLVHTCKQNCKLKESMKKKRKKFFFMLNETWINLQLS